MTQARFSDIQALPFQPAADTFSYGENENQFGELWPGEGDALLVLVHGGCWLNAYGLDHVRPLASGLAARGLNVASLEYRRLGDVGGGWPNTLIDVHAGIARAARETNTSRVVVAGHSAGGHLALWVTADRTTLHVDQADVPFAGAIGLAAIADLSRYAEGDSDCEQAAASLVGGLPKQQTDRFALADPALLQRSVPTALLQGDADPIVPPEQATLFASRHPDAETVMLEGAGHFDVIHPEHETVDHLVKRFRQYTTDD